MNSGTTNTGSGGPLTMSVSTGQPTITVNNQSATVGAVITGNQGLTKAGSGILMISNAPTYSGPTVVLAGTLQLQTDPLLMGLTNYYPFNGTANDAIGTSNGTLVAGVTLSSTGGQFGTGYIQTLGTASGPVTMGALPAFTNGLQARTISAWVQQQQPYPGQWNANYFGFNGTSGDHNRFYFDNNGGGVVFTSYADDTGVIQGNDENWHLYTATWDGNLSDPAQVYVDGQPVTTNGAPFNGISNAFGINIGGRNGFSGLENDLRVYNRALSPAEVQQLYTSDSPLTNLTPTTLPKTTQLSVAANATVDLGGNNQQVFSLSDVNGAGGSIINSNSGFAASLTISPTDGSTTTFSGIISGGGTLGTLGLTVGGTGTQVLTGSNTFTGPTTITGGGTLQLGTGTRIVMARSPPPTESRTTAPWSTTWPAARQSTTPWLEAGD